LAGTPKKEATEAPVPANNGGTAKPIPADNSPWTLQWEIVGGQTKLIARLQQRLEFQVFCDRLKMETADGSVVALGKVRFTGPGVKGTCGKLVIGLGGDSLVLDDKAELQVQQGGLVDGASSVAELKGESLALRLQQPSAPQPPPTASVTPTPVAPIPVVPAPGAPVPVAPAAAPLNGNPTEPRPIPEPRPFPLQPKDM
jgi:hypothetical protein